MVQYQEYINSSSFELFSSCVLCYTIIRANYFASIVVHIYAYCFLFHFWMQYGVNELKCPLVFRVAPGVSFQPCSSAIVVKCDHPQNADFPRYYSKREKKPFPKPIVQLRREARERLKKLKGQPRKPTTAPRNGLLVRRLIPLAYEVYNARITLINNVKKLMRVVPVHACK